MYTISKEGNDIVVRVNGTGRKATGDHSDMISAYPNACLRHTSGFIYPLDFETKKIIQNRSQ